jgi:hypothetical protein
LGLRTTPRAALSLFDYTDTVLRVVTARVSASFARTDY